MKLFSHHLCRCLFICIGLFLSFTINVTAHKIVITGGPGVGKTSLIEDLEKRGYPVIHEAATSLIQEELAKGNAHPTSNRDVFQQKLLAKQIEMEQEHQEASLTFLDRGMMDGIAYYNLDGLVVPQALFDASRKSNYYLIFVLDFLPNPYEINSVRKEPLEIAQKIHELIKKAYQSFGYTLIAVPPASIEDRATFVLNYIQEYQQSLQQEKTTSITASLSQKNK